MYPFSLLNDPPAPTYPEYEELHALARRTCPRFVDPANVYPAAPVAGRRGADWCTAVLGFPFGTVHRLTAVEHQLLIVADAADIDPPLPAWIVEGRAEGERIAALRQAARTAVADRDAAAWATARASLAAGIDLTVHESTTARPRYGYSHHNTHAVPAADVYSGRRRVHRAGRALCESPGRQKPLDISGRPVDGPVTCVRCLQWVPAVRATIAHDVAQVG